MTADSLPHPPCLTAPALHVRHGFFTREGGVSVGPYASLNGSLSGGDDRAAVLVNRGAGGGGPCKSRPTGCWA